MLYSAANLKTTIDGHNAEAAALVQMGHSGHPAVTSKHSTPLSAGSAGSAGAGGAGAGAAGAGVAGAGVG